MGSTNGTLANALDFDDGSHLSTHILPAVLATAERSVRPAADVLDAFIIAYEAAARLTQPSTRAPADSVRADPSRLVACRSDRSDRGGDHRLPPVEARPATTATAIGIASRGGGGFRRNMGTMAKALHSGNAARLRHRGREPGATRFHRRSAIIEAPLGFLQAVCCPEDRD